MASLHGRALLCSKTLFADSQLPEAHLVTLMFEGLDIVPLILRRCCHCDIAPGCQSLYPRSRDNLGAPGSAIVRVRRKQLLLL
jgi:hypothetical protein